ncbi:hypothetical protein HC864_04565 [Candidatus Gracilibacteria bacterium]|nr:hypothetical protein [Candidatus Gracilibacteria bacterium]
MNPTNQIQSLSSADNEFINSLVKAITGLPIENFTPTKQSEVQKQAYLIYQNFIYNYFNQNFDKKDLLRIQNLDSEPNTITKFPELRNKFDQAYWAFLEFLKSNSSIK